MSTIKKLTSGMPKKVVLFTLITPFAMTGEVIMEVMIPLYMANIIDIGIVNHDLPYVLKTGITMILFSFFSFISGMVGARLTAIASQGFAKNLRARLFHSVQNFSFSNIDHFSSGSLVTRLTTDVTNVMNLYQQIIRTFIRSPMMIFSGVFLACSINLRLAVYLIALIPVLGFILIAIALTAYPRFKLMLRHYDKLNTLVQENLTGIRLVKSFVRQDFENKNFEKLAADFRNAQLRAEKIVILNMPVMRICVYMCVSAVMWSGGIMAIYGGIQVGKLVSLITYVIRVLTSLMMLSMVFVGFILSRASIERIVEVLDEEPSIKSKDGIAECRGIQENSAVADAPAVALKTQPAEKTIDGKIEFDDVYFSYSSGKNARYSIKGVSLNIPSGQFTGIIGGTGCGKSTLIQLIPRLYDVTSGSVKVSGINVKDYDLKALRDKVSVVLQKNVLFSGTIRENLKWGNPSASDKELEEACRAADAHNFIMSLPQGYDTVLEQGGVNLSGGQRQRVCIARALLKKPAILILDDSTSAVDTATEKRIRTALRSYLPDSTIIVIAQRITSVQNADCIYVLDNGKISASGTHESLLKTSSVYQEVYESQQHGSGDADIVEEN